MPCLVDLEWTGTDGGGMRFLVGKASIVSRQINQGFVSTIWSPCGAKQISLPDAKHITYSHRRNNMSGGPACACSALAPRCEQR